MVQFVPVEEERRRPRFVPTEDPGIPISGGEAFNRGALERLFGNVSGLLGLVRPPGGPPLRDVAPLPSGEQAVAGIESGIGGVTGLLSGDAPQFSDRFDLILERQRRAEEERPFTFGTGQVFGDIGTLLTGRAPVAGVLGRAERRLLATRTAEEIAQLPPGAQRLANSFFNSPGLRKLTRGTGRSVETGLEGMVLAIAQDGDPLETAAYASGSQMLGSTINGIAKGSLAQIPGGLPFKLVAGAAVTGGLIHLLNRAIPGGDDFALESLESGFDKVLLALIAGGLVTAAGAGRLRGPGRPEDLPKLFDAITALPRGAILSKLNDYVNAPEADQEAIDATLERLRVDPGFFGEKASKNFGRALTSEDPAALRNTVTKLLESDEFRSRLEAPVPDPDVLAQETLREDVRSDTRNARLPSSRETAEAVAKRIGGRTDVESPKTFITSRLKNKRRVEETLSGLSKRTRLDALEITLSSVINDSTRRAGDRRVLDGQKLRDAWNRLPPETRSAYSEAQRDSIHRFIDTAEATELSVVGPLTAHALMLANGRLSRRLRGKLEER